MRMPTDIKAIHPAGRATKGFSLLEILVAMVIFTIVAGAAFGLFMNQEPVYNQQISVAGMSIGLNNAISQIQMNLVNAGTGEFVGSNMPNAPLGVVVTNQTSTACNNAATYTYTAACFDTMTIVTAAPAPVPALNPAAAVSTTSGTMTLTPATGDTAAKDAAYFLTGDEILLVKNDGSQLDTVVLTANGAVVGTNVQLTFTPTASNGTNAIDPLGITSNWFSKLGTSYATNDWAVKLNGVTYSVDTTTNASDPTLISQSFGDGVSAPVQVADQVIGFKIGAALWNSATLTTGSYIYTASQYTNAGTSDPYDYTLIRSIRVSLIGRTTPSTDKLVTFRNGFDGGPYEIQGTSIVVNPRNMSMNDN